MGKGEERSGVRKSIYHGRTYYVNYARRPWQVSRIEIRPSSLCVEKCGFIVEKV